MAMKVGRRWQVGLPPFHEKKFLLWAYSKRQSKTALAQNIIQARIEANLTDIDIMVASQAKDWNISVKEAEGKILDFMKYDPSIAEIDSEDDD